MFKSSNNINNNNNDQRKKSFQEKNTIWRRRRFYANSERSGRSKLTVPTTSFTTSFISLKKRIFSRLKMKEALYGGFQLKRRI